MGNDQQPTGGSSMTEKHKQHRFSFSPAAKTFLKDYFHQTNKAPKKKARQQILAHLKELGDTEVTDIRVINWFNYQRHSERKRPSSHSLSTSAPPGSDEKAWVDARHKSLWPSLTKESLEHLGELHAQHARENKDTDPPYDLWAEGLNATAAHVHMWCKFKARESARPSPLEIAPMAGTSSQMAKGHSQLPTPGTSTSPEPRSALVASPSLSPDAIKYELPTSPVVETTRFQQQFQEPKGKSSMGLHEAIETAFSAPLFPPAPCVQPPKPLSLTGRVNQQRKTSARNPHQTPPPTPPSLSTNTAIALTPFFLPSASTTSSPSKPEPSPHEPSPPPPHREPSAPPSPKEPTPGPSTQPDRDIACERANLAAGISAKLDELAVMFNSPFELSQLAGSMERISQRNQQFLDDVATGRFAHMRLTSAHLANNQASSPMPEFNPQRIIVEWREGKEKGKEREQEDEMEVD